MPTFSRVVSSLSPSKSASTPLKVYPICSFASQLISLPAEASETTPSRASRLIVRNLPFDITEQDLRAIFLPYGPIHSVHIPLADVKTDDDAEASSKTARSKGFAFVWMLSKKDAESALEKCNGIKVVAGMADGIVSDKQKRKKQRREEKRRQGTDGEEPEEVESSGKERVIAVDWALSKERWEKEKEKLVETVDQDDVEMDDAESEASTSGSDSEHEQLGFVDEEGSGDDEEDHDDDSDGDSPKKPQLPHTDTGNTLFIRNVPFTATEDEIRTLYVIQSRV